MEGDCMMKKTKQEAHKELRETMQRAYEWMADPKRTNEELEAWYSDYRKIVDEVMQLEKEMWGPIPW